MLAKSKADNKTSPQKVQAATIKQEKQEQTMEKLLSKVCQLESQMKTIAPGPNAHLGQGNSGYHFHGRGQGNGQRGQGAQGRTPYGYQQIPEELKEKLRGQCYLCGASGGQYHAWTLCPTYKSQYPKKSLCFCGIGAHSFDTCLSKDKWPADKFTHPSQPGRGAGHGGQQA